MTNPTLNQPSADTISNSLHTIIQQESFSKMPAAEQVHTLLQHLTHAAGYSVGADANLELPQAIELKAKPWGGYATLGWYEEDLDGKPASVLEKILVVYPKEQLNIPALSPTAEAYRRIIGNITGSDQMIALSFQRHPLISIDPQGNQQANYTQSDRIKEVWETIGGNHGAHLTAPDQEVAYDQHQPDLAQTKLQPLRASEKTTVEHPGLTWHSLVNLGSDYLIIHEKIYTADRRTFAETNIERQGDLFDRTGTNENK